MQQGDTVSVTAHGLYPQAVRSNFWFSLASFVTNLLQPGAGSAGGADPRRGRPGLPWLQVGVATGLPLLNQLSGGVPKGYLRVLVFDRDSALMSQQTEQLQATALNNYDSLRIRVVVPQDGYVSAYVGNESDVDVYFDDIKVVHGQGLQVQESAYDPTGLELAGLTGTTPGLKRLSQYKWNGKEFQTDLGLNWTQLDWRMFDPQLDHMPVVDPEVENGQESMSPYAFGYDNAVRFNDPDGRCPGGCPPAPDPSLLQQVGAVGAAAVAALAEGVGVVVGAVSAASIATAAAAVGVVVGLGYAIANGDSGAGPGYSYTPMSIPSAQLYQQQGYLYTPPTTKEGNGRVEARPARRTAPRSQQQSGNNAVPPRGKFRSQTVKDSWDNAKDGSEANTKQCPTCGKDVKGNPNTNESRGGDDGWDVSHNPPWANRNNSGKTRKEQLDNYNSGVELECIGCNRSRGANDGANPRNNR